MNTGGRRFSRQKRGPNSVLVWSYFRHVKQKEELDKNNIGQVISKYFIIVELSLSYMKFIIGILSDLCGLTTLSKEKPQTTLWECLFFISTSS